MNNLSFVCVVSLWPDSHTRGPHCAECASSGKWPLTCSVCASVDVKDGKWSTSRLRQKGCEVGADDDDADSADKTR